MMLVVKNPPANAGDIRLRLDPWVGKIPWRRAWQPSPVFLAWRIPWTEEPGGLKTQTQLSDLAHTYTFYRF